MGLITIFSASALSPVADAALAADLSSLKAPPVLPAPPMWAGFYECWPCRTGAAPLVPLGSPGRWSVSQ